MVINSIYNKQFMVINSDYYYYGILITIIITINQ